MYSLSLTLRSISSIGISSGDGSARVMPSSSDSSPGMALRFRWMAQVPQGSALAPRVQAASLLVSASGGKRLLLRGLPKSSIVCLQLEATTM